MLGQAYILGHSILQKQYFLDIYAGSKRDLIKF